MQVDRGKIELQLKPKWLAIVVVIETILLVPIAYSPWLRFDYIQTMARWYAKAVPPDTVFIGDSVTDCDRLDLPPYGNGYVRDIVATGRLAGDVVNVGTSGHRLVDLVARWDRDVIAHAPTRLSINIGINDTLAR